MRLHGSAIAERLADSRAFKFTMAGWASLTTKERLNALLFCGHTRLSIHTKNGATALYKGYGVLITEMTALDSLDVCHATLS
jgi:hypothetical protein